MYNNYIKLCTTEVFPFNSSTPIFPLDGYRNCHRIVHIPFFPASQPLSPVEQARHETALIDARAAASGSIGELIKLGEKLSSYDSLLPFVCTHLPDVHFRVQKCYALVLNTAELVSEH